MGHVVLLGLGLVILGIALFAVTALQIAFACRSSYQRDTPSRPHSRPTQAGSEPQVVLDPECASHWLPPF